MRCGPAPYLSALTLPALLAACGNPAPTTNETVVEQAAPKLNGWADAFGRPDAAIAHANQFGYSAGEYAQQSGAWLSQGKPIMMSQSDAKSPNQSRFEAAGATKDKLDRIVFTLDITDPANADTAKTRFVDVLRGFVFQYQIDGKQAFDPVLKEQPFDGDIAGSPLSIAIDKRDGEQRTITVTFTRPTGTTPVSPDQGQADGNRA